MIFKDIKIYSQLFLIFLTIFLEYSITTIDFLFLEKISYLATIGVASLISLIYMIQRIIALFVGAMIDNSLYHYSNFDKSYKDSLLINFVFDHFVHPNLWFMAIANNLSLNNIAIYLEQNGPLVSNILAIFINIFLNFFGTNKLVFKVPEPDHLFD